MSEGSGHRSWATNGYRNRPFRPRNIATELPRRLRRWIAAQPSARTTARLRWEMGRNKCFGAGLPRRTAHLESVYGLAQMS